MAERNADPEAWLADQLAQLPTAADAVSGFPMIWWAPGEEAFAAVEKIAHEYGEMCAARALDGTSVEIAVDDGNLRPFDDLAGRVPAVARFENDKIVVRPA